MHEGDDDRERFKRDQVEAATAMGSDDELKALGLQTLALADRRGYTYMSSWLGLPIIQFPSDIVILQEILWEVQPTVVVETGVARGGSLILYASILELIGHGRVIGIDIDMRAHNESAIRNHPLAHRIELLEGSSVAPPTITAVQARIRPNDVVMVVLDSDHSHDHVLREIDLYSPLVSPGSFLVVADTVVADIPPQDHRPRPWGSGNNPATAVREFLSRSSDFIVDPYYNGKLLISSSPGGYLRRMT